MNPLTNVKNIQKLGQKELELGLVGKKSWHDQYKDSAWIFVGGLPYDLTEGDVICVFSQYGEVVNINLVRDKKTGQSLGYGFLCYEDQRSTVLAVDNLNGIKILSRTIRVDHVENYRQPKDTGEESNTVKKLRIEGCAPKIQDSSSSEEGEVKDSPPSPPKRTKKDKLERKIRKKSKKRKKKKSESKREDSDDSSSKSSSNSQVGASSGAYVSDVEVSHRGHAESPNSTMNKYPQHPVPSRRTNNNNLNTKAPFCPKRKYNDCNEKYDSKSRFVASSSSNTYGDAGNRVRPQDNRFDGRREYSRNNNDRFSNSWNNRFDGVRHTTYGIRSPHKERQEFRDYEQDEYREDVRESDRVSRYSTRGESYRGREDVYARRESGYGRGTYPSRGGGVYVQREGGYPPREGGTGLLRDPVFPPRDPNYAHRGGETGFPQRDSNYQPRNSGYSQRDDNYSRDNRHGKRDESYSQRDGRFQSRDTGYLQRETTNYRQRGTVYVERERVYPQRDRNYTERIRTGTERSRNYSDGPSTDHVRVGGEDYRRERSYRLSDDSRERNYNRKPEYDRDRKRSDRPYERRER